MWSYHIAEHLTISLQYVLPRSEPLWRIFHSPHWHCQTIVFLCFFFFYLRQFLVWCHWNDNWRLWSGHIISSWQWIWSLPMGLFIAWWYLTQCHLWYGLYKSCLEWFCCISFLMLRLFTVILLLMPMIHKKIEKINEHNSLMFDFR